MDIEVWKVVVSNVSLTSVLMYWIFNLLTEKKTLAADHKLERASWVLAQEKKDTLIQSLNNEIKVDAQKTLLAFKDFEKIIDSTSAKDFQAREEANKLMKEILEKSQEISNQLRK